MLSSVPPTMVYGSLESKSQKIFDIDTNLTPQKIPSNDEISNNQIFGPIFALIFPK
jgi:hypothetical protein